MRTVNCNFRAVDRSEPRVVPGGDDGYTSITVRYFHALGANPTNPTTGGKGAPNPAYTEFETVKLIRPRSRR
jgi:hypothetical protein